MIMISTNFILNFTNFSVIVSFFLTKLLTLGISFSTAARAAVVAKLVMLGISFLTLFTLLLRVVLIAKLVILDILSSIFLMLALYTPFFTTSLSLLKSTGTGTHLSTSNLSTLLFKLFKLVGIFFNLSISNLSTLDFKLAKSTFLANLMYQHLLHFLNLLLLHN